MAFGSNSQDKIEIVVEVDAKTGIASIKQLGDEQDKLGKKTKEAGKTSDEFFQNFAKSAGAALGAAITLQTAIAAIGRGSDFDSISVAFDELATKAGTSSSRLLADLQKATAGTISNFDLIKMANEDLLSGLDPNRLAPFAEQVRTLSNYIGIDFKEALDIANQALITGNDTGLKKRLGLNIDLQASEQKLKDALGDSTGQLTEAAKVEADRLGILEAMAAKTQGLVKPTDSAADKINQLKTSINNATTETLRKIASDQVLLESLDGIAKALNNIDWAAYIRGIGGATAATISFAERALISLGATIENIQNFAKNPSLKTAFGDVLRDQVPEFKKQLGEVNELLEKGTPDAIKTARAQFVDLGIDIQKSQIASVVLAKDINELAAKLLPKTTAETKKTSSSASDLNKRYEELAAALGMGGLIAAQKSSSEEAKKATEFLKKYAEQLEKAAEKAKELNSIKGLKGVADEIKDIYNNAKDLGLPFSKATDEILKLREALIAAGLSAESFDIAINKSLKDLSGDVASGFNLGAIFTDDTALQAQLNDAGSIIASGLVDAISSAISGDELSKEEIGQSIGSTVGAAAATAMGAPELAPMASQLGAAVGDFLSTAFGSDSAGTQAKKALDATITEVFKDLQFSGNQNPLNGLFADLPAQAQAAYTAVGDAITGALGQGTDLGVNLGVVLANNNLTLADTQALLEALGLGFNELSEAMYQAFYNGELSALDLQNRLEEIYGIINGSTAFENLGAAVNEAFSADGRTLLNALRGIGQQAQATGVTLGSMPDILVNKFGVAADRVQQLMAAMAAAGIKSVADLANAANPVLVALAANITQAQQGVTPDNVAVVAPKAASSGGGSGGGSKTSAPRATTTKTKTDPNAKAKAAILSAFNKVQSSGAAKDLDAKIQAGLINDADYAKGMQALVDSARTLQSGIDDAQTRYIEDVRKGSKDKLKDLEKLNKLKDELEKTLKGAEKEKSETTLGRLDKFAQAFAGNIQLIQMAAKSLNVSFRDLKEESLAAFLAGTKTFAEAKNALDDATGGKDPKKQFDLFKSLGANGGAFSEDAFKKIAKAVQNSGGTDLNSLSEMLLGSGANAGEVQKLFIALQNSGVNSLDQIANAGTDLVITVGAQLQDLGFGFADTTSTIRNELKSLDDLIQQNRKLTVEADVIISPELRALLGLTGNPLPSSGSGYAGSSPGVKSQAQLSDEAKLAKLIKGGNKKKIKAFKEASPYV